MSTTGLRKVSAAAACAAVALTVAACGESTEDTSGDSQAPASGEETTMRLGHVFPDGSEIDEAADAFAAAVEERTDGAVSIQVFPGGQIGSDEEMATALNSGSQEAAILSQGASGFGERPQLQNIPYLVSTYEEADQVFYGDGWVAQWDRETLAQNGIVGLEFVENGFRGLSNSKKKVEQPTDLDGLKIRAPSSDLIINIFADWGAQAVAIPFPELYTALEQGTVDGQENGVTLFSDSKLYEVQDYYTDTRYTYATAAISVSQGTWDALTEEQQTIMQEEAEAASLAQREAVRTAADERLEDLKTKIDVTILDEAALEEWRASVQPSYDRARETYGDDVIDELLAATEEARG